MPSRKHVAVIMGGVSSEHDVSLNSGRKVSENLNADRYRVTPVTIHRDGAWEYPGEAPCDVFCGVRRLKELDVDCVYLALHGPFGEDGRFQGMLDILGLPYIGSGCAASALAMDKVRSKAVVAQAGVRVAPQVLLGKGEWERDSGAAVARVEAELGFPCVAKSPNQGSSLGMAIPQNADELGAALPTLFQLDDTVLVEGFLRGREVTCAVLDVEPGTPPRALPPTEIRPVSASFFDYHAKYTPGATEEITPAPLSIAATGKVQRLAERVHMLVGCRGLSRSDMILVDDEPVWLEVNTLPGMTQTSLMPQAAAAAGISFSELVGLFVEAALARD
ncbi:MAG: D-alanine--D-alanine ligase [Candidatus Hydrogenedentota bacterium]